MHLLSFALVLGPFLSLAAATPQTPSVPPPPVATQQGVSTAKDPVLKAPQGSKSPTLGLENAQPKQDGRRPATDPLKQLARCKTDCDRIWRRERIEGSARSILEARRNDCEKRLCKHTLNWRYTWYARVERDLAARTVTQHCLESASSTTSEALLESGVSDLKHRAERGRDAKRHGSLCVRA